MRAAVKRLLGGATLRNTSPLYHSLCAAALETLRRRLDRPPGLNDLVQLSESRITDIALKLEHEIGEGLTDEDAAKTLAEAMLAVRVRLACCTPLLVGLTQRLGHSFSRTMPSCASTSTSSCAA